MTETWSYGSERYRFSTSADLPLFAEMLSDPEVGTWLWFTPAPPEMFEGFFRPFIEGQAEQLAAGETPGASVFTVEDRNTGEFLGQGAAIGVQGSPGGFEIGFQLCRAAWGRGVGSRLARFLVAYAVHRCEAYRIEAACLEGNTGSRAILERLGLVVEGSRPGYRLRESVRHAEVLYGVEVARLDAAMFRQVAAETGIVSG